MKRGRRASSPRAWRSSWMQEVRAESPTMVSGQAVRKSFSLRHDVFRSFREDAQHRQGFRRHAYLLFATREPLRGIELITTEADHGLASRFAAEGIPRRSHRNPTVLLGHRRCVRAGFSRPSQVDAGDTAEETMKRRAFELTCGILLVGSIGACGVEKEVAPSESEVSNRSNQPSGETIVRWNEKRTDGPRRPGSGSDSADGAHAPPGDCSPGDARRRQRRARSLRDLRPGAARGLGCEPGPGRRGGGSRRAGRVRACQQGNARRHARRRPGLRGSRQGSRALGRDWWHGGTDHPRAARQ